jgi:SAM-dependent methyltransferase
VQLKCVQCGTVGLDRAGEAFKCKACRASFPIRGGVPRFVGEELYTESFGYQWNRFARTQLDSASATTQSRDTFLEKTGWDLGSLRGRRVLDAGCGSGRFAEICADAGAEVHGVDLSTAVEAAHANLGARPNVHLYQADIMNLPFPENAFDFIFSLGVLIATPNTAAAFAKLPPLLRPGGSLAVWVYSTELKRYWGGEILRKVTPALPKRWLLHACKLAIPLYHLHRTRYLGRVTQVLLPTGMDADPEWRWLNTFDWYSPKYQWKHRYEEVESWFRAAGLADVQRGPFPVSVSGRRPAG